jgi:hypothetical protein
LPPPERETMKAGGKTIELIRFWITDDGRKALTE